MGRTWLDGKGKYRDCYDGNNSDCFNYAFKDPSPEDLPAPELQEATDMINRILEEVAKENPDPNRELAILAVRDVDGEDYLQLAYIDASVSSPRNFHEVSGSQADKSRRHIR
jgi:hypothetical protein